MKQEHIITALLLISIVCLSATVNLDYAVGDGANFGLRVIPRIEFWRVQAVLDFPFVFNLDGNWLTPALSPLESLKRLDLDLGSGGVKFNAPQKVQVNFSNIDFHAHSLVAWSFDGSIGATLGPESALFFKTSFFNACIDVDGQYHVGLTLPTEWFEVGGFVSSRGYGFSTVVGPFVFLILPENGFRFAMVERNIYLSAQFFDGSASIALGWLEGEEWFFLGTNGLEMRMKLRDIAITLKLQKERWYAGLSFPILW
ncbi:hypothetical protein [Pseudothermotoga sp.]|uniref:hypothetical protein n=1 Tax=Pseudothermotoga sp. TaxID=2033661 RepID=UPI0031F6A28C